MFEVGAVTILFVIVVCILILILWLLSCGICFYVGLNISKEKKKPPTTAKLTKEEEIKKKKEEKALENFYSYDGDTQSD